MKKQLVLITLLLLSIIHNNSFAQTIPEAAREKYVMAITLRDQAKNASDYDSPIAKFKDAIALAPAWTDAYKELGLTLELAGQFDEAITNLNKYISLNPSKDDARKAQDEIYIIKAKKEKSRSPNIAETKLSWPDFSGKWGRQIAEFYIEVNGDGWIVSDANKEPLNVIKTQGRKLWVEDNSCNFLTTHYELILSEDAQSIMVVDYITQSPEQNKRKPDATLSDLNVRKNYTIKKK